jgi:hypothetical protein
VFLGGVLSLSGPKLRTFDHSTPGPALLLLYFFLKGVLLLLLL